MKCSIMLHFSCISSASTLLANVKIIFRHKEYNLFETLDRYAGLSCQVYRIKPEGKIHKYTAFTFFVTPNLLMSSAANRFANILDPYQD